MYSQDILELLFIFNKYINTILINMFLYFYYIYYALFTFNMFILIDIFLNNDNFSLIIFILFYKYLKGSILEFERQKRSQNEKCNENI